MSVSEASHSSTAERWSKKCHFKRAFGLHTTPQNNFLFFGNFNSNLSTHALSMFVSEASPSSAAERRSEKSHFERSYLNKILVGVCEVNFFDWRLRERNVQFRLQNYAAVGYENVHMVNI